MPKPLIELNTDLSQGIRLFMNKSLLISFIFIALSTVYLFSQETDEINELHEERLKLADILFPVKENEWKDLRTAFLKVKRENFIDGNYRSIAYENMPVPQSGGLIQPSPQMIADILKESSIRAMSRVLLIGRNSLYINRLISELTENLYVSDPGIIMTNENKYNVKNDLSYYAWLESAPFNTIIIFGSVEEIPQSLVSQLANNGKIIAPITYKSGSQILVSAMRFSNGFEVTCIGDSYIHSLR